MVSRWEILAIALNAVVGSGIYLLPAAAAAILGPQSLWAVAAAGFAVLLIVLCFAEAGSYFEEPGSAYLYAREAFGDFVGFEVGWMTWLARVASIASLSAGFAQALTYLLPAAADGPVRSLAILLPLLGLTWINIIGVKAGVRTAVVLVAIKLIPLAVLVVVGLPGIRWERIVATQPVGEGSLASAAVLLLFAYAGFENTAAAAGEFRRPKRDVPRALLMQIGIVTGLYVVVQWVALGTVPDLGSSLTPLADTARTLLGSWGGWLLTVGAVFSILGNTSGSVLAGPRYLFALGRDGYGPRALSRIHPRYRTPAIAIAVQTALAIPLALTGSFVGLAALSVVARLATYLGTAAAVPILRRRLGADADSFRLPGGATIPILACALSVGLAAAADTQSLVAGAIALVAGAVIYRFRRT